jgi:hypothetical protein
VEPVEEGEVFWFTPVGLAVLETVELLVENTDGG